MPFTGTNSGCSDKMRGRRPITPELVAAMRQLRATTALTLGQIAAALGVGKRTVWTYTSDLGDPEKYRQAAAARMKAMKDDPSIAQMRLGALRIAARGREYRLMRQKQAIRTNAMPHVKAAQSANGKIMGPRNLKAAQEWHRNRWHAWCPDEYRPMYRDLIAKHVGFDEAQLMVLKAMDQDEQRRRNKEHAEREANTVRSHVGKAAEHG